MKNEINTIANGSQLSVLAAISLQKQEKIDKCHDGVYMLVYTKVRSLRTFAGLHL